MGGLAPWHWLILAVILLLVFGGRGKLSSLMGDAAKGIKAFREGLKGKEPPVAPAPPPLAQPVSPPMEKEPIVR